MKTILIALAAMPGIAFAARTNEFLLTSNLHQLLVSRATTISEQEMRAYSNTIAGTNVTYRMVPIHGGEFLMGSRTNEIGRHADEGPQHRVRIEPFWMGAYEVTWNEYEIFLMATPVARQLRDEETGNPYTKTLADAVAMPSKPYIEPSMGMGRDGFPSINMTQHAANKYCEWLSALTGHYYRLPTEAEWEYACRAGSTNRYCFGDDEKLLTTTRGTN